MGKALPPLTEALDKAVTAQRVWLTTEELAERFRTSPSTCRYWRLQNYGPTGVRVGRRTLYELGEVERWEAEQLQKAKA